MPKRSTWEQSHPECAAATREAVDAVRAEKNKEIERLKEENECLRLEHEQMRPALEQAADFFQMDPEAYRRKWGLGWEDKTHLQIADVLLAALPAE